MILDPPCICKSEMAAGVDMGDHPPITPVRAATEGQLGDAYRLYDPWAETSNKSNRDIYGIFMNFNDIYGIFMKFNEFS